MAQAGDFRGMAGIDGGLFKAQVQAGDSFPNTAEAQQSLVMTVSAELRQFGKTIAAWVIADQRAPGA